MSDSVELYPKPSSITAAIRATGARLPMQPLCAKRQPILRGRCGCLAADRSGECDPRRCLRRKKLRSGDGFGFADDRIAGCKTPAQAKMLFQRFHALAAGDTEKFKDGMDVEPRG